MPKWIYFRKLKGLKQSGLYVLLVLASSAVWIVLGSSGLLDGIDQEVMRWRYLARGEIETKDNIVYVDLDAEQLLALMAK